MTPRELASMIDHTLLRSDALPADIERLAAEALSYGFASACVNPVWVPLVSDMLSGGFPLVCSVVGFPLGASNCIGTETAGVIEEGADEVDMVIPVGHLKAGNTSVVAARIRTVVSEASGRPVKVIIETCYLTSMEKRLACRIALDEGASWVKTSTGFGTGGATAEDVRLMKEAVSSMIGVKASGGIRTLDDALLMIDAGAGRLGASSGVAIINELAGLPV